MHTWLVDSTCKHSSSNIVTALCTLAHTVAIHKLVICGWTEPLGQLFKEDLIICKAFKNKRTKVLQETVLAGQKKKERKTLLPLNWSVQQWYCPSVFIPRQH